MVNMLALSALRSWGQARSGQTNDYKFGMCCFSTKHSALRRKSKDWLALNQDNVSNGVTCLSTDYCFNEPAIQLSVLV